MERWTPAEVLAAANAVDDAWPLPSEIDTVQTDDYSVLCRPAHLTSPTSGRVQAWIKSPRRFSEVRPEVERLARERGKRGCGGGPGFPNGPAIEEDLRSAGAHLVVTHLVMARPLGGIDADAWLAGGEPPGVETTVVADAATFRALTDVETTGFGPAAGIAGGPLRGMVAVAGQPGVVLRLRPAGEPGRDASVGRPLPPVRLGPLSLRRSDSPSVSPARPLQLGPGGTLPARSGQRRHPGLDQGSSDHVGTDPRTGRLPLLPGGTLLAPRCP